MKISYQPTWKGVCSMDWRRVGKVCANFRFNFKPSKMGKECAELIINFRPSIELQMKSMFHEMCRHHILQTSQKKMASCLIDIWSMISQGPVRFVHVMKDTADYLKGLTRHSSKKAQSALPVTSSCMAYKGHAMIVAQAHAFNKVFIKRRIQLTSFQYLAVNTQLNSMLINWGQ